jgi:hypothetical protein
MMRDGTLEQYLRDLRATSPPTQGQAVPPASAAPTSRPPEYVSSPLVSADRCA